MHLLWITLINPSLYSVEWSTDIIKHLGFPKKIHQNLESSTNDIVDY